MVVVCCYEVVGVISSDVTVDGGEKEVEDVGDARGIARAMQVIKPNDTHKVWPTTQLYSVSFLQSKQQGRPRGELAPPSTVGNLHSFSDNGYFSPQKWIQCTYTCLKCPKNSFWKFLLLAFKAL